MPIRRFALALSLGALLAAGSGAVRAQDLAQPDPVQSASPEMILPVASATIAAGETITDAMLAERPFNTLVAQRYAVATTRSELIGKVARRMLLAGNPILANSVAEAQLVRRGALAQLRFEQDGLRIVTIGMPMDSGPLGGLVRVKNVDSGRIVSGIVQADGSVVVGDQ